MERETGVRPTGHGAREVRGEHESVSRLTGRRAWLGTAADALAEMQAGTDLSEAVPPWPEGQVPRDLEREYGALHAFVLSVGDAAARAELLELLYPLFAHCFFTVARHYHSAAVRAHFAPSEIVDFAPFFARYAPAFRAVHGDELGAVFACRTFNAMAHSPVARRFGREREDQGGGEQSRGSSSNHSRGNSNKDSNNNSNNQTHWRYRPR